MAQGQASRRHRANIEKTGIRINRWTDWIDLSESNCTVMAAIYCATQKYTVNSGLGIYDLTGSHRPKAAIRPAATSTAGFWLEGVSHRVCFLVRINAKPTPLICQPTRPATLQTSALRVKALGAKA